MPSSGKTASPANVNNFRKVFLLRCSSGVEHQFSVRKAWVPSLVPLNRLKVMVRRENLIAPFLCNVVNKILPELFWYFLFFHMSVT